MYQKYVIIIYIMSIFYLIFIQFYIISYHIYQMDPKTVGILIISYIFNIDVRIKDSHLTQQLLTLI